MIISWNNNINELCGPYYDRLASELNKKTFFKKKALPTEELRLIAQAFLNESDRNFHGDAGFLRKLRDYAENHGITEISQLFNGELGLVADFLLGEEWGQLLRKYMLIASASPYTEGYSRRSIRSKKLSLHLNASFVRDIKSFVTLKATGFSTLELLRGGRNEEEIKQLRGQLSIEPWLSVMLEMADKECCSFLIDAMTSENNFNRLNETHFRAIAQSGNPDLLEVEGRLLLAARLQEGLRQAIVETMDEGKPESLIYMLGVIKENNLQRFASVKRALAVITGLTEPEAPERITDKFLDLVISFITDRKLALESIDSEDAMAVYLSLWSIAFYEVADVENPVMTLIESAPAYRVEAAIMVLWCLEYPEMTTRLAEKAIRLRHEDHGIVAGALSLYLSNNGFYISWYGEPGPIPPLKKYFSSEEQAERDFDMLVDLINSMKGTEEFDPYVFPWIRVTMSRGDVAEKIGKIALLLDKPEYTDRALQYLVYMEPYARAAYLKHLLIFPKTPVQIECAVKAMTDRAEMTRDSACEIVKLLHERKQLREEDYKAMESHLRLKAASMRVTIINILASLPEEEALKSVTRLLSDKTADRRLAGLDIIKTWIEKGERKELCDSLLPAVEAINRPTSKEKVIIDSIKNRLTKSTSKYDESNGFGLYNPADELHLKVKKPEGFNPAEALLFADEKHAYKILEKLNSLIEQHSEDEFVNTWGEDKKLGLSAKRDHYGHGLTALAFPEIWKNFYEKEIGNSLDMLRLYIAMRKPSGESSMFAKTVVRILGKKFYEQDKRVDKLLKGKFGSQLKQICSCLYETYGSSEETIDISADIMSVVASDVEQDEMMKKYKEGRSSWERERKIAIYQAYPFDILTDLLRNHWMETDECLFLKSFRPRYGLYRKLGYLEEFNPVDPMEYIRLWREGNITDNEFWHEMIGRQASHKMVTIMTDHLPEAPKRYGSQKYFSELTPEECVLVNTAIDRILEIELQRGDTPTVVSKLAASIQVVVGADYLVKILRGLGKDKPISNFYAMGDGKRAVFSWLLHVCYPAETDTPEYLMQQSRENGINEERLVEAALFSPQWLDIVERAVDWQGLTSAAYYFLAHTGENLQENVKQRIARYTSVDADDFADGAFDPVWFHEVYDTLGKERFDIVYDAAKYISEGNRHTRARKLSDAVLGKLSTEELEKSIKEKRNKDSVVAYGLVPINRNRMKDLRQRYGVLNQFLKESRQFGSQRQASEGRAVNLALANLARTAGFGDSTRLMWSMEADLIKEVEEFLKPKDLNGTTVYISFEDSKPEMVIESKGKRLQSMPAKLKKDPYAVKIKEVYKKLKDQHVRGRQLLEKSMNDYSAFTGEELASLRENPIIWEMLSRLVLIKGRSEFGFPADDGKSLVTSAGEIIEFKKNDLLRVAHPYDLYKAGVWSDYQNALFERMMKQPFKQVFRELYVATSEEKDHWKTLRYAGNQIMPAKTVALLKKRGWITDYEYGLQKVSYQGDVTAVIYALADWFSPSDIEAPTLEYVAFYHRRNFKEKNISDVAPVVFSELMRDVDLAVSVAHAGGVDPETSHSTMEMRKVIVEHTLPMFGLANVEVIGNFAKVKGELATYQIHLGSGVVHKEGGAQIAVLPVHSQGRGKIFLPFLDEDPKTAEIISKILLFAEDRKIKDPFILDQI